MMKPRWWLFSALLATLFTVMPAFADDGDVVHVGHSIHVPSVGVVQDAVCIFCSIHVDGRVTGDVVTIFGNVYLSGDAQHDVVSIFGSLHAEKSSNIGNDVVNVFGDVELGPDAHVGHDLVALFGGFDKAESAVVAGDTVIKPLWIVLTPLLILALIVYLLVHEIRTQRRRYASRGLPPAPKG